MWWFLPPVSPSFLRSFSSTLPPILIPNRPWYPLEALPCLQSRQSAHSINKNAAPLLIITNTPHKPTMLSHLWHLSGFRICIDGGLNHLFNFRSRKSRFIDRKDPPPVFIPDLVVGDFDSVSPSIRAHFESKTTVIHNPDQNSTDLEKSLEYVQSNRMEHHQEIFILGGFGGCFSHQLGNIHAVFSFAK